MFLSSALVVNEQMKNAEVADLVVGDKRVSRMTFHHLDQLSIFLIIFYHIIPLSSSLINSYSLSSPFVTTYCILPHYIPSSPLINSYYLSSTLTTYHQLLLHLITSYYLPSTFYYLPTHTISRELLLPMRA